MIKVIVMLVIGLIGINSFASTITCQGGDQKTEGIKKVLVVEDVKKDSSLGLLLERDNVRYYLSISDIYEKKDPSKITSKDAMVLSSISMSGGNGSASVNVVSDGNNLMYFDNINSTAFLCTKSQ